MELVFEEQFEDLGGWQLDPAPAQFSWAKSSIDNVEVEKGKLKLHLTQEQYGGYIGARLNTRSSFKFLHGKVEFRAKLPHQVSVWPALWTMADPWPAACEIDVVEVFDPTGMCTGHFRSANRNVQTAHKLIPNADIEFHTYAIRRSEEFVSWQYDGEFLRGINTPIQRTPHWLCIDLCVASFYEGLLPKQDDRLIVDYVKVWE